MDHIKPERLFAFSLEEPGFELDDQERDHLHQCDECQHIVEVFTRHFKPADTLKRKAGTDMPKNGEINWHFGVYANLCCGREIIIREGATFPECLNHPNLPTVWKLIEIEIADVII